MEDFLDAGFRAIIISCDKMKMGERFLGREISRALIDELEKLGVDVAGEKGEYHTFVCDGPLFKGPIAFTPGAVEAHEGYLFLGIE